MIASFKQAIMMTERKPTHPGAIIREDIIKHLKMTQKEFAKHLGVRLETISRIVNERSNLSPDMAVKIGEATGTSAESWMNLQEKLDLWKARKKNKPGKIKRLIDNINNVTKKAALY